VEPAQATVVRRWTHLPPLQTRRAAPGTMTQQQTRTQRAQPSPLRPDARDRGQGNDPRRHPSRCRPLGHQSQRRRRRRRRRQQRRPTPAVDPPGVQLTSPTTTTTTTMMTMTTSFLSHPKPRQTPTLWRRCSPKRMPRSRPGPTAICLCRPASWTSRPGWRRRWGWERRQHLHRHCRTTERPNPHRLPFLSTSTIAVHHPQKTTPTPTATTGHRRHHRHLPRGQDLDSDPLWLPAGT